MPTTANDQQAIERRREPKGPTWKVGNITRDPELKFGANGTAYANFTLVEERPKEAGNWSGERITEYYDVVCFRTLAENVAQSLPKGRQGHRPGKRGAGALDRQGRQGAHLKTHRR